MTFLPIGWRFVTSRTIGGQEFWHVEHTCGWTVRGKVTQGQLDDHEALCPTAEHFRDGSPA